jgi:hypothetical protein
MNFLKHNTILLIFLFISIGGCMKKANETAKSTDIYLKDFLWKNRPVIIFVDSKNNGQYKSFKKDWNSNSIGTQDRDIILFEIISNKHGLLKNKPISDKSVRAIINQLGKGTNSFEIILVGKDGSVKLRSSDSSLNEIFSLIDSMPMRKYEIQQKEI